MQLKKLFGEAMIILSRISSEHIFGTGISSMMPFLPMGGRM